MLLLPDILASTFLGVSFHEQPEQGRYVAGTIYWKIERGYEADAPPGRIYAVDNQGGRAGGERTFNNHTHPQERGECHPLSQRVADVLAGAPNKLIFADEGGDDTPERMRPLQSLPVLAQLV